MWAAPARTVLQRAAVGVTPDIVVDARARPPDRRVSDVTCPGIVSADPVADDPVVARAVSVLK